MIAAASARAVARVSEPAKRGSQRWTARVAPQASISRRASAAVGGPIVNTTTSPSVAGELDRLGVGPPAEGADLQLDAFADETTVLQAQLIRSRDLLDQDGDAHRIPYTIARLATARRAAAGRRPRGSV